jgi:phage terminase large subunit-like protein
MTTYLAKLEEGKVLSKEEITKMYEEGKVKFVKAYGAVLKELTNFEDIYDELGEEE